MSYYHIWLGALLVASLAPHYKDTPGSQASANQPGTSTARSLLCGVQSAQSLGCAHAQVPGIRRNLPSWCLKDLRVSNFAIHFAIVVANSAKWMEQICQNQFVN